MEKDNVVEFKKKEAVDVAPAEIMKKAEVAKKVEVKDGFTRDQIVDIWEILIRFDTVPCSPSFAYGTMKNKKKIIEVLKGINEKRSTKQPEEILEFEKKRIELCEQHSELDDNGLAIMEKGAYKIIDFEAFGKDLATLKEENKDVVEMREAIEKDLDDFMKEKVEFKFYRVDVDQFPNLSPQDMEILEPMIK